MWTFWFGNHTLMMRNEAQKFFLWLGIDGTCQEGQGIEGLFDTILMSGRLLFVKCILYMSPSANVLQNISGLLRSQKEAL